MGFLGSLTGWDQVGEANNAVVANHLVETCTRETKKAIVTRLIQLQKSVKGSYAGTESQILHDLDNQPRCVQMNFVALACNSLGIAPTIPGSYFDQVQNPYRAKSSNLSDSIQSSVRFYSKRTTAYINWPGDENRVKFSDWL